MAIILIADDDRATRETLAGLLRAQGHETYSAGSAFELLELVRQHPRSQLVLTDLKMPRMDGIQVLDALQLENPQARVVIMSAFSTAETVVAAFRRGAVDYLQKPFDWQELQEVLHRALGEAAETASSPPTAGDPQA